MQRIEELERETMENVVEIFGDVAPGAQVREGGIMTIAPPSAILADVREDALKPTSSSSPSASRTARASRSRPRCRTARRPEGRQLDGAGRLDDVR